MRDPEPLRQAAANCRAFKKDSEFYWSYEFEGLQFAPIKLPGSKLRHTRPRNVQEIRIEMEVSLRGVCLDGGDLNDPLQNLVVGCKIEGDTVAGTLTSCAWHLDKEGSTSADESDEDHPSGESHFVHPDYHFQYGGRKVWHKEDGEFGTHLLLESPRLAHPPMDAILAVDFVLANYYGEKWKKLREGSGVYIDLVRTAQERLWKPYATATAHYWGVLTSASPWSASLVWPQLN